MEAANAPFFVDNEVIVLTKNGTWVADGVEITHEGTRKLFARALKHDADGYFLSVGRETKRIQVEDTPYFVMCVEGDPTAGFTLCLNDETEEPLDPQSLKYAPGRLVCAVRGHAERAKFLHSAYFQILQYLEEDSSTYFLNVQGKRVELAHK